MVNTQSAPKTLVLIDGKSVFYRGFYAMPNLSTRDGMTTGGVYGFAVLALELFARIKPDYVVVAWDKAHTNIRRRLKISDKYKANRHPAPPEFYAQIPLLHELLDALNWPFYEVDDYEADDIIGTFDRQAGQAGLNTIMISSDLDLLQLLDNNTELYALKKGLSNLEKFDPNNFRAKYGIDVVQFADMKALKGDASDNISGVPGIGEKTAAALLKKFKTLDSVFAATRDPDSDMKPAVRQKLINGEKSARISRQLVEIFRDAPLKLDLEKADVHNLDPEKLHAELTRLEFTSLIRRLPDFMLKASTDPATDAPSRLADVAIQKFHNLSDVMQRDLFNSQIFVAFMVDNATESSAQKQSKLFDGNSAKSAPDVIVSPSKTEAYQMSLSNFENLNNDKDIITHDAKVFTEQLLKYGAQPNFRVKFDTRLAMFLINSLHTSPNLATAVHFHETDDDGTLRAMTSGEKVSAIWSLYETQKQELEKDEKLFKLARVADFPLQILLAQIEQRGVRLNVEKLRNMSAELASEIAVIEQTIWQMAGHEFNISSPVQLSEVLFKELKLPIVGIKKSARGNFSTGQKELDKLHGQHPIIEQIEQIRELLKLKNTYVDALPNLVDENSYLHTTFRQDVTATGRLSSSAPNLQNIPTRSENGAKIREAFVTTPGKIILSADYSQFELRLAAALAHDKNMIKVFANDDVDIHTTTAAEAFNVPIDQVTPTQRRHAKVINFGVLYGMSPHGLAVATGMDFHTAKLFIDRYFAIRRPIREFLDATIKQAETKGFVETLFGRRRPTPDVRASNFIVRESAKRAAANMPIQGTEADLMKMAMLKIEREIPRAKQFMQIHDSIMVECDPADANEVTRQMKQIMENIYPDLGVRLRVDVKRGTTWAEL